MYICFVGVVIVISLKVKCDFFFQLAYISASLYGPLLWKTSSPRIITLIYFLFFFFQLTPSFK